MEEMLLLAIVAVVVIMLIFSMCQPKKNKNHPHKHAAYTALQEFVAHKPSVVYFYSPMCGYCQQFDPVWDQMVTLLGKQSPVMLAKICASNLQEIQQYPTIMYFPGNSGAPITYTGQRDIESMARWIDICQLY